MIKDKRFMESELPLQIKHTKLQLPHRNCLISFPLSLITAPSGHRLPLMMTTWLPGGAMGLSMGNTTRCVDEGGATPARFSASVLPVTVQSVAMLGSHTMLVP